MRERYGNGRRDGMSVYERPKGNPLPFRNGILIPQRVKGNDIDIAAGN